MPGFQPFFGFLCDFVLAKLATTSTRVKKCHMDLSYIRTLLTQIKVIF